MYIHIYVYVCVHIYIHIYILFSPQLFSNSHNSRGRNILVKCLRIQEKGIKCSYSTALLEPERFMIHCTLVKVIYY